MQLFQPVLMFFSNQSFSETVERQWILGYFVEQQPHHANCDPLNAGSVSTLVTHLESKGKGQQGSSWLDAAASEWKVSSCYLRWMSEYNPLNSMASWWGKK